MHEDGRGSAEELRRDIGPRCRIGGRREGCGLHAAELIAGSADGEIFGPEGMPPLRYAMRLVDRQQAHIGALELCEGAGLREALGRDVEQPQGSAGQPRGRLPVLSLVVGRVEARGRDPAASELRHLVAHQRDQRRDHDRQAVAQQRRQLIAQRLAAAGGHHREHVAAGQDGIDDLTLAGPELGKAEHSAQQVPGVGEVRHGRQVSQIIDTCR